jgi:hypothetical protein
MHYQRYAAEVNPPSTPPSTFSKSKINHLAATKSLKLPSVSLLASLYNLRAPNPWLSRLPKLARPMRCSHKPNITSHTSPITSHNLIQYGNFVANMSADGVMSFPTTLRLTISSCAVTVTVACDVASHKQDFHPRRRSRCRVIVSGFVEWGSKFTFFRGHACFKRRGAREPCV